jgi:hypothetical protein
VKVEQQNISNIAFNSLKISHPDLKNGLHLDGFESQNPERKSIGSPRADNL